MAADDKQLQLTLKLAQWAREYYELDNPTVSDAEYDLAFRELKEIELANGEVLGCSPTNRVGGRVSTEFASAKHERPLLSLDNVFNLEELLAWIEKLKVLMADYGPFPGYLKAEPKMDGLAVNLLYIDGFLVHGLTRGDGETGELVTAQLLQVNGIPTKISGFKKVTEIRGEVVVARSVFARLNAEQVANGLKPWANCRNLAAGSVRQLDPAVTKSRQLQFVAYQVLEQGFNTNDEHVASLKLLETIL
jgi:DNA ligase (NAD+)